MSLDKFAQEVIGAYMEIRAAAQDLDREIRSCLADLADKQPTVQDAILLGRRPALDALFTATRRQATDSLARIDQVSAEDPKQRSWAGDQPVHIRSELVLVDTAWPGASASVDATLDGLRKVSDSLDRIVYLGESLTLTPRLADVLENARVGQSFGLEALLADDLPRSPELRARLFGELADQNGVLELGYYDAPSMTVYRVDATRAKQRASAWRVLLAIVAAHGLVALACYVKPAAGWPFDWTNWPSIVTSFAFLFLGVGAHGIIQGITVARRSPGKLSHPWNDWVTWTNAHETPLMMSVVTPVVVFFIMRFLSPNFGIGAAFFTGYSIDSITDVLLDRFSQLAGARGAALAEALKPKPAAPPAVSTSSSL